MRTYIQHYLMAVILLTLSCATQSAQESAPYCAWQANSFSIDEALCGLVGDAERGRALAANSHGGNCLACHVMPIAEESFHGTVGPPLHGVGSRYSAGQIRLRIVNEQQVNPFTIMPGFYRRPESLNRLSGDYWGKTILSAQQVEDLVAYLESLK